MVYLQAMLNERSPAFACFGLVDDDKATLCVSAAVIAEVLEVLTRPSLQAKFPQLTTERVRNFKESMPRQLPSGTSRRHSTIPAIPTTKDMSTSPSRPVRNLSSAAIRTFWT